MSSAFVVRQVKYVYDWVKPSVARRYITFARVDVLVLLRGVLAVLQGAVGPGPEPLGVLGDPGMVGGGLDREVERNLEAEALGRHDQPVEVGDGAEFRVDGGVAAL